MNLPRVLFLTNESPHTAAAGSIVFHRLYQDYPADRLLVVTNRLPPAEAGRLACRYEYLPLAADRLSRTRLWLMRPALRALGASALVRLDRVDRLLEGFKADVVVTLMQDSWYYDLAARYALDRGLPLVLFGHDLPSQFEPVPGWLHSRQAARDRAVYRQAAARLCISRGMVDWFAAAFDATGTVLLPPRSDNTPAQKPELCRMLKTPGRLTLGYAGGLHYGYGEQLLTMLPVFRQLGVRVEMFGSVPAGNVATLADATDVFHFHGHAPTPEAAWQGLLAHCDAVLQPYLNPPGQHELQYRTHFPSKLGDCLALGLPLLITGPAYASGMAWCLDHPGCALGVSESGGPPLLAALQRLQAEPELRVSLATRAREVGGKFAPAALRRQLTDAIVRAVPSA